MAVDKKNSRVLIIVAVIGLTGTLGTALIANWDKLFPVASPPLPFEQPLPDPRDWPIVADVPFALPPDNWSLGSFPTANVPQFEIGVMEGKYRWSMRFGDSFPSQFANWERVIRLPYGPQVEFYLAVDIRVVEMSGYTGVALIFGTIGKADYVFRINSNSKYSLKRFDGEKMSTIINWKTADIDAPRTLLKSVAPNDPYWAQQTEIQELSAQAWQAFARGEVESAIEIMQQPAALGSRC